MYHLPDARKQIRLESNDTYNRIHSIAEDAAFVTRLSAVYPQYPIYPNLRCGAWYVDPQIGAKDPVYFKSTDGHFGQWNFTLRRSNLHLLRSISEHSGLELPHLSLAFSNHPYSIILVDSTRNGKRFPDALSKTVPIWCGVINSAISKTFQHEISWKSSAHENVFYTPPGSVSRSEHSQIESHIEEWANRLLSSEFQLPLLHRPLRPIWITPDTSTPPLLDNADFYPVICVSASRLIEEGMERRNAGFTYVQGSGDDHETWSQDLTPALYWKHRTQLLACSRADIPSIISSLVATSSHSNDGAALIPVSKSETRLYLGTVDFLRGNRIPNNVSLLIITAHSSIDLLPNGDHVLVMQLPSGKKGQLPFLTDVLPKSLRFAKEELENANDIAILCDDGKDVSVGVAVAALALYFDDDGKFLSSSNPETVIPTKASINKRLQWIQSNNTRANPSRTTLKRVNEYLMSQPRRLNAASGTIQ